MAAVAELAATRSPVAGPLAPKELRRAPAKPSGTCATTSTWAASASSQHDFNANLVGAWLAALGGDGAGTKQWSSELVHPPSRLHGTNPATQS